MEKTLIENSGFLENSTIGTCCVDGCQEPLMSNINHRYKGTFLCRKHRNQTYKKNYKKKSKEFAVAFEDCEEIFSGSPEPMHGQLLADMLDQVLTQKRLDLMQSPEIVELMQHHQKSVKSIMKEKNANFQLPTIKVVQKETLPMTTHQRGNKALPHVKRKAKRKNETRQALEAELKIRGSPSSVSEDTNLSNASCSDQVSVTSTGGRSTSSLLLNESPNRNMIDDGLMIFQGQTNELVQPANDDTLFTVDGDFNFSTGIELDGTQAELNYSRNNNVSQTFTPTIIQGSSALSHKAVLTDETTPISIKSEINIDQNLFTIGSRSAFLKTGAGSLGPFLTIRKNATTDITILDS